LQQETKAGYINPALTRGNCMMQQLTSVS